MQFEDRMAVAPVCSLESLRVAASVEYGLEAPPAFELLLWLEPSALSAKLLAAGEFWTLWSIGTPRLVHFKHRVNIFNRAVFAAVEVLAERDRALVAPDALWFPSTPRPQPTGAPL